MEQMIGEGHMVGKPIDAQKPTVEQVVMVQAELLHELADHVARAHDFVVGQGIPQAENKKSPCESALPGKIMVHNDVLVRVLDTMRIVNDTLRF